MGIIGKLVGGTIGFALGGPLGAIAGAVFGHAFDSNNQTSSTSGPMDSLSMLEASQLAFFVSTFSMLAKLAGADGRVSDEEIKTVQSFAVHDLGLSPQNRDIAFNIFNTALHSPARFEDFAQQFFDHFQKQPQLIEMMVDILLRVSTADGVMNVAEESLIRNAVHLFRMPNARYEQLKAQYISATSHAYDVLGCHPDDSDEDVKKQYRKLVHTYHPDKITGKGLPDEFSQLAQEKFREIQDAYESVKKQRGMK